MGMGDHTVILKQQQNKKWHRLFFGFYIKINMLTGVTELYTYKIVIRKKYEQVHSTCTSELTGPQFLAGIEES
jgi:hypothetical protein